jgi:hypothetical protein
LAKHLLHWLPEFALKYSELEGLHSGNLVDLLSKAVASIYKSERLFEKSSIDQYLRQLEGVDDRVHPPKSSHFGNCLINKNRLRHFRKQFYGFHHIFLAATPGLQVVPT